MKVVLLSEGAIAPKRVNEFAAGYDLFTPKDVVVNPGRNMIPLDIAVELDPHTQGEVRPCSGSSIQVHDTEKRLDADVILGTVDEDYRGVVGVIIKSFEKEPFLIKHKEKIAQLVVKKYVGTPFEIVSELTTTDRGTKGFGQLEHQ